MTARRRRKPAAPPRPVWCNDGMDSSPSGELIGIKVPSSRCNPCSKEEPMENRTVVAVDLAKTVFQIAVSETPGEVARCRRLNRAGFQAFIEKLTPATVVMEACGSAHHWGRRLQALGHSVQLLPAHLVRPYVPRNKTDRADALGILE